MSAPAPRGQEKVFCVLPWVGLTNMPNGDVFPCCHWRGRPIGSLRDSTLDELQNAPALVRTRRDMLKGRPVAGCSACYELERTGCPSQRLSSNETFSRSLPAARATAEDGRLERPGFRYFHVAFSNVCNFRCRTCHPDLSTGWFQDMAPLADPGLLKAMTALPPRPLKNGSLLPQIVSHLGTLDAIYFQGGEPLLSPEHYELLEELTRRKLFHIRLVYNTNFSVLGYGRWDAAKLWDRFEDVYITASLDGMGRRAEYLRKGQDWEQTARNRERLSRECPRAQFAVGSTVSVFNVLHIPDFVKDCVEKGFVSPKNVTLNIVRGSYCIQVLPPDLKREAAEKYEAHAGGFLSDWGEAASGLRRAYRGLVKNMLDRDLTSQLPALRRKIVTLDKIRGESFREVFPELSRLF